MMIKKNEMIEQLAALHREFEKSSGIGRMAMAERVGAVALNSLIKMAAQVEALEGRIKQLEAKNA